MEHRSRAVVGYVFRLPPKPLPPCQLCLQAGLLCSFGVVESVGRAQVSELHFHLTPCRPSTDCACARQGGPILSPPRGCGQESLGTRPPHHHTPHHGGSIVGCCHMSLCQAHTHVGNSGKLHGTRQSQLNNVNATQ